MNDRGTEADATVGAPAAAPFGAGVPASVVSLDRVSLSYGGGRPALENVTFALAPGSFHFLLGGSGAGKTSLLRLIHLDGQPTRGTLRLFEHDVAALPRPARPALRRRIGVVFQDFRLLDHLTVRENVALPMRIARAPAADIEAHVPELLHWVGLGEHLDDLPATLSGGQKQRVAIARAMALEPDIMLFDEATSALDPELVDEVLQVIKDLCLRSDMTMLFVTHQLHLVETIAERVIMLDGGKIIESGSPSEVLHNPQHPRTQAFISALEMSE